MPKTGVSRNYSALRSPRYIYRDPVCRTVIANAGRIAARLCVAVTIINLFVTIGRFVAPVVAAIGGHS